MRDEFVTQGHKGLIAFIYRNYILTRFLFWIYFCCFSLFFLFNFPISNPILCPKFPFPQFCFSHQPSLLLPFPWISFATLYLIFPVGLCNLLFWINSFFLHYYSFEFSHSESYFPPKLPFPSILFFTSTFPPFTLSPNFFRHPLFNLLSRRFVQPAAASR